jgi:hypothetical protein
MENVIMETKSVMTPQPTECDNTLQYSVAEDATASVEIQSTSFPAATNDEDQGISNGFTDLDYLDGPTIMAEVNPFFHTRISILTRLQQPTEPHDTENISVTPKVSGSPPPQH